MADTVILLHRPDYYGITEDEDGNSTDGMAEIICEKSPYTKPYTIGVLT